LPIVLAEAAGIGLLSLLTIAMLMASQAAASGEGSRSQAEEVRRWIQEMKTSPRGPFSRIRWFCHDGAVLPPEPFACKGHGGGVQHGELNARARALRDAGYRIANVLAAIDPEAFFSEPGSQETLKQVLLERFLVERDDGWIFREARFYRGALHAEEESWAAYNLLLAMLREPAWRVDRYTLLREAVRLLPHRQDAPSLGEVRGLTAYLVEQDPGFASLRNKIHGWPDAQDAGRVRKYAASEGKSELQASYQRLADGIEARDRDDVGEHISSLARQPISPALAKALRNAATRLAGASEPEIRLTVSSALLAAIREQVVGSPRAALPALDASLTLENEAFAAANLLRGELPGSSRHRRLTWAGDLNDALYGVGLISERQRQAIAGSLAVLAADELPLTAYRAEVSYLARVAGLADRRLRFHFQPVIDHLAAIDPLVQGYFDDRLRSSPLLAYTAIIDSLVQDADRTAGVRHELFGEPVVTGLRPLNPGLARGPLRVAGEGPWDSDAIYILPATATELLPLAGILTLGEGNALSHVQLLARNLGIPNVAMDAHLLPQVTSRRGQRVVLAVSRDGVVGLYDNGPSWDGLLESQPAGIPSVRRADLDKLDLRTDRFIPLDQLGAEDSGRRVGPKAAHLGELKRRYPEAVTEGLVIPFGFFHALLQQPLEGGGPPMGEWMAAQYAALLAMEGAPELHRQAVAQFLGRVRAWIEGADPGEEFRLRLRAAMASEFGTDGSYGVFVRSDTNVEDLPTFTGAGLNLTVPHVIGVDNVLRAISRVWASPFSDRAFAWRQAHVADPLHVYPSVLLLRSVPVEKSGVMVTVDVDTGRPGWLSIAVNEGIGGAVAGQAAEELRVDQATGRVRLLAEATAPTKRRLRPEGGLAVVAASGSERILEQPEIDRLIALAGELPDRVPTLCDDQGRRLPADVEFGFLHGKLALFQIRPLVDSPATRRNAFLASLDRRLPGRDDLVIDLAQVPSSMDDLPRAP
jgi:hypothetical protein